MIKPHTFASLSHNIVYNDCNWSENTGRIDHIELASWLDLFLIAPATANTLAKIAHGIADNLLTATAIAIPVKGQTHRIACPAMNTHMYISNPMVRNLDLLQSDGWEIIEPAYGRMACNSEGCGVLSAPRAIIEYIDELVKEDSKKDV